MRREKGKPRLRNKRVVLNGLVWKFGTKKGQRGDVLAMEISQPRVLGFSMCSALKHGGTRLFLLLPGAPEDPNEREAPPASPAVGHEAALSGAPRRTTLLLG